jgi:hypothetical protein
MTNDTDFLPHVLLEKVRQTRRRQRVTALDCAIDAATATDAEQRAWALVALAARLREDDERARALEVLDAVVAFDPPWEVQSAAFTTAAAIHCDLGDLKTARSICDETLAKGVNEYILSAAVRVYWELARSTRLQEFHDRRKDLSAALEELTRAAAAPATT